MARQTTGNTFTLTWQAVLGHTYHVQFKTNLNQRTWSTLTNVTASSWTGIAIIPAGSDPQRFYHIIP
jgi:hypothetical protein